MDFNWWHARSRLWFGQKYMKLLGGNTGWKLEQKEERYYYTLGKKLPVLKTQAGLKK